MFAALLFLAACEDPPPPPVTMHDLLRPMLVLNTGSVPGKPETVQVFLYSEAHGPCHPLPELKATLDGTPMERLHGKVDGAFSYDRDCDVYEFSLPGPTVAPTTTKLEVTDGVVTASAEVENLFVPRTLSLVGPKLHKRGDVVTLAYTPVTDVPAPQGPFGIQLNDGTVIRQLKNDAVKVGDGTITFTLPADLPDTFEGDVGVEFLGTANLQPTVKSCVWTIKCTVSRSYEYEKLTIDVEK